MDERVERARKIVDHPHGNTAATAWESLRDMVAAYDDLATRRKHDIRVAVILERGKIDQLLSLAEEVEETDADIAYNSGIFYARQLLDERGPATDPATIRREAAEAERERFREEVENRKQTLLHPADIDASADRELAGLLRFLDSLPDPQESKP